MIESWLSDLWARGRKCLGCLVGKEKKKKTEGKKTAQGQKESKPVCLIKERHWASPKAASLPFPAQKGKDSCSSQGFEEFSPSPGRRGTPGGPQGRGSPGVGRGWLAVSLCHPNHGFGFVPAGDSQANTSGQHKGNPAQRQHPTFCKGHVDGGEGER